MFKSGAPLPQDWCWTTQLRETICPYEDKRFQHMHGQQKERLVQPQAVECGHSGQGRREWGHRPQSWNPG